MSTPTRKNLSKRSTGALRQYAECLIPCGAIWRPSIYAYQTGPGAGGEPEGWVWKDRNSQDASEAHYPTERQALIEGILACTGNE
jgi:hypothetical protein